MARKVYDYDAMSEDELREHLKNVAKRRVEITKKWQQNNPGKNKEYQKKYRASLTYALNQLKYWQRKVEELSNQNETEAKE